MKALFLFICALVMAYPAFVNPAFADTGVRIVVPARDIARGETIADSDLTYAFVATNAVMPGTATNLNNVIGMQTRRVLRAGESMRNDDVRAPIVILKG